MKNKEENLLEIIRINQNCFPLGYQYLEVKGVIPIVARVGQSLIHSSNCYFVSYYHKPISLIY